MKFIICRKAKSSGTVLTYLTADGGESLDLALALQVDTEEAAEDKRKSLADSDQWMVTWAVVPSVPRRE